MGTKSEGRRRLALITGGNVGIGRDAAGMLASEGFDVVIACRDVATAEAAASQFGGSAMRLDLSSFASIRDFAAAFRARYSKLDLLVCNAGLGASFVGSKPQTTADGLELTVGTNHYGHFLLVQQLLPVLAAAKPARVVVVSSVLHYSGKLNKEDPQLLAKPGAYSGSQAYNNSKLYNAMFALSLNARYASQGITANAVHPGFIPVSNFLRNQNILARGLLKYAVYPLGRLFGFTSSVKQGAQAEVAAALTKESGVYIHQLSGPRAPLKAASDAANQAWLWEHSESVTGCKFPATT